MRERTAKIFQLIILSFLIYSPLCAQVGGISASKLNAFNHAPIPVSTAEFEPNYSFTFLKKYWDENKELKDIFQSPDSIEIQTSLSFRLAYPFSEKFEIGAFIADGFTNWSMKYSTYTKNNFGLGIFAGLNVPFGSIQRNNKNKQADQISSYGYGIIASYEFSESFSIDANLQLQDYFDSHEDLPERDWILYIDAGKYLGDTGIQLVGAISYQTSSFDQFNQNKFSFYPGISIETKSNYNVVLNGMLDLTGKNIERTNGIAFAWTITL